MLIGFRSGLGRGAVGGDRDHARLGHNPEAEKTFGRAESGGTIEPTGSCDGIAKSSGTVKVIHTGFLHGGGETTSSSLEETGESLGRVLINGAALFVEDADVVERERDVVAGGEAVEFQSSGGIRSDIDLLVGRIEIDPLVVVASQNDLGGGVIALGGAREIVEGFREVFFDPGETGGVQLTHGAETGGHVLLREFGKFLHRSLGVGLDLAGTEGLTIEKHGTQGGKGVGVACLGAFVQPLPSLVVVHFLRTTELEVELGEFELGLTVTFTGRFLEQLDGGIGIAFFTAETVQVNRGHVAAGGVEPPIGGFFDEFETFLGLFHLLARSSQDETVVIHRLELTRIGGSLVVGHRLSKGILLLALLHEEAHRVDGVLVVAFVGQIPNLVDRLLQRDFGSFSLGHGGHGLFHGFHLSDHFGARILPFFGVEP